MIYAIISPIMKERQRSPEQAHAERKLFVERAMQEGALSGINPKKVGIGLMYIFNDELTLDDIAAQVYPEDKSGKTNASLLYRGFIKGLWDNSSEQTRSSHALKDLSAKKPLPQKSRERRSESRKGSTLGIRDLILQGAKDMDELKEHSNLSIGSIRQILVTLEGWGIDISQFIGPIRKGRKNIEQLLEEEDDKKIQIILDELSVGTILANTFEHKGWKKNKNPRVFTTIGRITLDAFHYKFAQTHLFAESLEDNGIPNRRIERVIKRWKGSYCVLLKKHRDRALAVWEKDPILERFKVSHPVTIVCGDRSANIPTATQLYRNYRSVRSVLSDSGIQVRTRQYKESRERFFEDCPITVWAYQRGRYIAASDIDKFKQYSLREFAQ